MRSLRRSYSFSEKSKGRRRPTPAWSRSDLYFLGITQSKIPRHITVGLYPEVKRDVQRQIRLRCEYAQLTHKKLRMNQGQKLARSKFNMNLRVFQNTSEELGMIAILTHDQYIIHDMYLTHDHCITHDQYFIIPLFSCTLKISAVIMWISHSLNTNPRIADLIINVVAGSRSMYTNEYTYFFTVVAAVLKLIYYQYKCRRFWIAITCICLVAIVAVIECYHHHCKNFANITNFVAYLPLSLFVVAVLAFHEEILPMLRPYLSCSSLPTRFPPRATWKALPQLSAGKHHILKH